jgi:hypothetical protein
MDRTWKRQFNLDHLSHSEEHQVYYICQGVKGIFMESHVPISVCRLRKNPAVKNMQNSYKLFAPAGHEAKKRPSQTCCKT